MMINAQQQHTPLARRPNDLIQNMHRDEDSKSFTSDPLERAMPSLRSSSHFISLNEVMQSGHGSIEINSTISTERQYHVPGDATSLGSRAQLQAQAVHHFVAHEEPSVVNGDLSAVRGQMEDNDLDLYAVSPILGVSRLPNPYDGAAQINISSPEASIPFQHVESVDATTSEPGLAAESRGGIVPERYSTSETQSGESGGPASRAFQQPHDSEGLQFVESSVHLRVSIVNRSTESVPIAVDNNDHSTLECLQTLQFIETASVRQYSFTSEHHIPIYGLINRTRSSLRRILSARNRFIAARSRSFMRRIQREVDLEMQYPDFAWGGAVELEAPEPSSPCELAVSPSSTQWGRCGSQSEFYPTATTLTRSHTLSRMTYAIFGPNLPRTLRPMYKTYLSQVEKQFTSSMENHELHTPNTLNWPNPLPCLEECLMLVASRLRSPMKIEDFVHQNMADLIILMEQGPSAVRGARPTAAPTNEEVLNPAYLRIAHGWMLFCLEAWTLLDMTATCKNRHDLRLTEDFCTSSLDSTVESLLPRLITTYNQSKKAPIQPSRKTQFFPHDMAADILEQLAGVTFIWTNDLSEHLALDTQMKTVSLYSHVAFAYLHAEAGTDSSLNKSGLLAYHRILTEITASYCLLFGSSNRSRKMFSTLDPKGRSPGYFNIFSLNERSNSVNPKLVYNLGEDFPVFGDRLVELKSLLKPKGLRGLWRDTRDTLQWYTFWAVAIIGAVSLLLGVVQMALGAVQAYASMKALGSIKT